LLLSPLTGKEQERMQDAASPTEKKPATFQGQKTSPELAQIKDKQPPLLAAAEAVF